MKNLVKEGIYVLLSRVGLFQRDRMTRN